MSDDKLKRAAEKGFLGFGALYESAINKAKENLAQGLNEFGFEDRMKADLGTRPNEADPNSEREKRKRLNEEGRKFRERQQKGRYQGY